VGKKWETENADRVKFLDARKSIVRLYGLSKEQAEVALISYQGDLCGACREFKKLLVDHDHVTGQARGMICYRCNHIAGALEDRRCADVQAYLERSSG